MLISKADMLKAMGVFGLITTCDLLTSLQSGRPLVGGVWLPLSAAAIGIVSLVMVVRSLMLEE